MKKQALRLGVLLAALLLCLAPRGGAFSDVDSSSWYAGAVAEMTEAGLLSGYPDGTFRPGQTISAAELVAIAARAQDQIGRASCRDRVFCWV